MAVLKRRIISGVIMGLLLCFSAGLSAQEEKKEPEDKIEKFTKFIKKKRVNAAYIIGGLNTLHLDTLNRYLAKNDYPSLPQSYMTYGVGGHIIHNKFIVGLEIHRFLEKNSIGSKAFNTNAMGRYFILNFGYLLHEKNGLMAYPLAGVGFGQLTLRVTENNVHSFQDINNFQKGSESITRSFLVNLGFGADYFFNYSQEKKGKNSLMVGVRAGYVFSAIKDDWSVNHVRVADGPIAGLSSPYICIVFGLGGWMEKFIEIAIS